MKCSMCDKEKVCLLQYFRYTIKGFTRLNLCATCIASAMEHILSAEKIGTRAFFIAHNLAKSRREYLRSRKNK